MQTRICFCKRTVGQPPFGRLTSSPLRAVRGSRPILLGSSGRKITGSVLCYKNHRHSSSSSSDSSSHCHWEAKQSLAARTQPIWHLVTPPVHHATSQRLCSSPGATP